MRDEYNIEITQDMGEELSEMGGLMEPLLEIATEQAAEKAAAKATAETEIKTKLEDIRSAMKSWGLTAEDAMNGLNITPELQKKLLPLI